MGLRGEELIESGLEVDKIDRFSRLCEYFLLRQSWALIVAVSPTSTLFRQQPQHPLDPPQQVMVPGGPISQRPRGNFLLPGEASE